MDWVYTWKKEVRITVKLPYVINAEREMPDGSGGKFIQKDDGFGDLRLALPLKRYFNLDGKSGSWTLKPMLRIPLSEKDEYDFYYKEFGAGIGAGYEAETADFFFGFGSGGWVFDGDRPAELHTTLDFGYNYETKKANGSVFWETDFHYEDDESKTLSTGPAFTLTTTIPFIRESSGSSTSSITKVFLTMETGMCSRSESVGFSENFVKQFAVRAFSCPRVYVQYLHNSPLSEVLV